MGGGCNRAIGAVSQQPRHFADQGRGDQRLVTLNVHDNLVRRELEQLGGFGQAVCPRGVVRPREQGFNAVLGCGVADPRRVGGDGHPPCTRLQGAPGDSDHHRHAVQIGQRLVGQAA